VAALRVKLVILPPSATQRVPFGLLWFGWVFCLLISGCSPDNLSSSEKIGSKPIPVEIASVGGVDREAWIEGSGEVRFDRRATLSFPVAGVMSNSLVEEGDPVTKGQSLARLQPEPALADSRAADSEAQQATRSLVRIEALAARGFATRAQQDAARSAAASARATVARARFVQRGTHLTAPTDGVIIRRLAEPGQAVQAGTPIFEVGDRRAGLVVVVGFLQVPTLSPGTLVELRPVRNQGAIWSGRVRSVRPERNSASGMLEIKVAVPPDQKILPGTLLAARVRAPQSSAEDSETILIAPAALVDARADQATVYVVDRNRRARRRAVLIDGLDGERVRVRRGLVVGDKVIVRGGPYVSDGQPVIIVREMTIR
jgi:RND family efflux transporter MFP subunit